ncbi:hypothetical protein EXIGLDRAFT_729279 [Exidia glandulosa HHB12029]|uniref:Uncharacterized protein n=1 Tax=Exidia glandulosa HHB12029 TaxID=1314781 RepID=A0A165CNQ7_EXIGL|nr:hypothetical protein EXIGLDRAFT_729279 [Exidia glandulosa HHB12029]
MPNRQGAVLSAPAPQANDTMREAKLAKLFPPASDKASSSDYTQTPSAISPPRANTSVDAALPELYAAMRDAGFTVHTLLDHLRQAAVQGDEPHSEMLPLYEDPRRGQ